MVAKFLDHRMAFGFGFAGIFLCLVRALEFLEFVEVPQMHPTTIPSPKMCWFFFVSCCCIHRRPGYMLRKCKKLPNQRFET